MKTSVTGFKAVFTHRWRGKLPALLALSLMTSLGVWQLHRAAEKQQMLDNEAWQSKRSAEVWQPSMVNPRQYQKVTVSGYFLPEILLLDNQHYQHQFGFHVISPFQLENKQLILVDRGWIKGDINRRQFPAAPISSEQRQIQGQIYYPSKKVWVLGEEIEEKTTMLAIIERIDANSLSQLLHKSVYPFIMRLDRDEADGFVRDWPVVSMPPARHYAYAVQWFAMALAILVIFVSLNLKKVDETCET